MKTLQLPQPYKKATYLEVGTGAPVLFIHGLGLCAESWHLQIAALQKNYRIIAINMPAHGGSSPLPQHSAPAELPDFVAWLHAVICALELTSINIVGHSMGTLIAGGYAVEYPNKVQRVALLNGVYCRDAKSRQDVENRANEIAKGNFDIETPLNRWFGTPDEIQNNIQPIREQVAQWLRAVDINGYAASYGAFARGDDTYAKSLSQIKCPLLALTGSDDINSTPAMSQSIAAAANGKVKIVQHHRHLVNLTAPQEVNCALQDWLQMQITSTKAA